MFYEQMQSPVGRLTFIEEESKLRYLSFGEETFHFAKKSTPLLSEVKRQLEAYFAGTLFVFDLPLQIKGTVFQQSVWEALRQIPYGQTVSYGQLARRIGRPSAVRAVGGANHRNPISIIVPCHRVIGADGSLTGYGGGLAIKEYLLALEQKVCPDSSGSL